MDDVPGNEQQNGPTMRTIRLGDFEILPGEKTAIIGNDSSGRGEAASCIARLYPAVTSYMKFRDSYGTAADREYFHQLRWNHGMMDDDAPTGRERLLRSVSGCPDPDSAMEVMEKYCALFSLEGILDEPIVTYSSGEMRKFLLVKALLPSPEILLLDSPYIGLDHETRDLLSGILSDLSSSVSVVLVLSRPDEIPPFITHVMTVENGKVSGKYSLGEFSGRFLPPEVVSMRKVSVRYGRRTILRDLDWTVREGERWVLTGGNGSGKSTLLSLICADNPMAYACDMSLFGRKRGSGESIWDIKRNIGYVSPEMHRAFRSDAPCLKVVGSGLSKMGAIIPRMTPEQEERCLQWMEKFGIADLKDRPFYSLEPSLQRLTLVCRAFVKEPPLLVLDEPMHGLDEGNRRRVREIMDEYFTDPSKTLIMVTHYPEEYPSCINRSLTLRRNL